MFIKKFLLLSLISEYKSSIHLSNEKSFEENQEKFKLKIQNNLEIKYLKCLCVLTGTNLVGSMFFFDYKNKSEKYKIILLLLFLINNFIWKLYFSNNLLYDNFFYSIFISLTLKILFTIGFSILCVSLLEIILGNFKPLDSYNEENNNNKIFSRLLFFPIIIDLLISLYSPAILNYVYDKKLESFKNIKEMKNSQKLLTI